MRVPCRVYGAEQRSKRDASCLYVAPVARAVRVARYARDYGPGWTGLYIVRRAMSALLARIDHELMRIEIRKNLTGPRTISAQHNTIDENYALWNDYDWSKVGEEWTTEVQRFRGLDPKRWKQDVIDHVMARWIPEGSAVVEIGPGAGRWTEHLQTRTSRLVVADIAEKCLEICQQRFGSEGIVYYHVRSTADGFLPSSAFPDASFDAVWSYDVFVHINASDTARYLHDIARLLSPGGVGVIHHVGRWDKESAAVGFRAPMDCAFFARLVKEAGLRVIEQSGTYSHKPGDVITVFRRG